jgi:hypothetical protein
MSNILLILYLLMYKGVEEKVDCRFQIGPRFGDKRVKPFGSFFLAQVESEGRVQVWKPSGWISFGLKLRKTRCHHQLEQSDKFESVATADVCRSEQQKGEVKDSQME